MTETDVSQSQKKIRDLLETFIDPGRELQCEHCKKFLKHLSDADGSLIDLPVFMEWTLEAVAVWYINSWTPTTNIACFTLNLCGLLSRDELRFCSLNNDNFYIKLVKVVKARDPDAFPQIQLAYINFLASLLEHKSGIEWMMVCSFWEDVLQLSLTSQDTYIIRESRNFITKFLEKCVTYDEKFVNDVVKKIMSPLGENAYKAIKALTESECSDAVVYTRVSPTLQLIGSVLEYFLENSLFAQKDFRIPLVFLENFHMERRISDLMSMANNKYLCFDLGRMMFLMQFLDMYFKIFTKSIDPETVNDSIVNMLDVFRYNISKGNFDNVMKFCYFGIFYWNLIGQKILLTDKANEAIMFANELIAFQVIPLHFLASKYCFDMKKTEPIVIYDDVRDQFFDKFIDLITMNTIRIAYLWRDCFYFEINLFEVCSKVLIYCLKSRKYFPRFHAVTVLQTFVYALGDIVETISNNEEKLNIFVKETSFFSLLFECIYVFIEEFQITWKDSSETFDILSITFSFLDISTWASKAVVKALNVLRISIRKYLAPNLALLIDSTDNSTTAQLGPLLNKKLKDECSEVRSATLEIVAVIAELAKTEFPSLQKILIGTKLTESVVEILKSDKDSMVKATAIRCLQELIQVDEISDDFLEEQHLVEKMEEIVLNENEGTVRVDAVRFLSKTYEHNKILVLENVYKKLSKVSTTDVHWEVKVYTLNFWNTVIKNHLQDQGMIDGSFPSVTFSKEHRKIVTLTDLEIEKRLRKSLEELSKIGCLNVLVSILKNDCDIEVINKATEIIDYLSQFLKKYNVFGNSSRCPKLKNGQYKEDSSSQSDSDHSHQSSTSSRVLQIRRSIRESVSHSSSSSDNSSRNFQSDCFSSRSSVSSSSDIVLEMEKTVTPDEFIHFIQYDFDNIIKRKEHCLRRFQDLRSLMEDMLNN